MNKLMLMLALFFLAFPALAQLNGQQLKEYETRLAANPNDQEALLKLGIYYHNRGGEGDEKAVDKAVDFLDRLLQLNNRHTVAMAFYGSAVTMQGRDAFLPWNKMKYVNEGIGKLDKAVMLDSTNLRVRMVRGMNSVKLPDFLNRRPFALRDFAFIVAHADSANLEKSDRVQTYYFYGSTLKQEGRLDEAKTMWGQAANLWPEHPLATRAAEELKK
ncbi:MAG: tetratricopeptide repeat protein [bacterium]